MRSIARRASRGRCISKAITRAGTALTQRVNVPGQNGDPGYVLAYTQAAAGADGCQQPYIDLLRPNGSGFRAQYGWNLVASDDEWSAPIDAQVGPDGHMWVIDWYAFIVQHNPTPQGFKNGKGNAFETELRDKAHGRIYRVVYKKAKDEKKKKEAAK